MSLSIEARRSGARAIVIVLRGEVDYATAQDLRATISAILIKGTIDAIIVDLAGVTLLDSTGIGTLVVAYRICGDCGVRFSVRDASPFIAKLLTVLGVAEALGVPPVPGLRRQRRPIHEVLDGTLDTTLDDTPATPATPQPA